LTLLIPKLDFANSFFLSK